MHKFIATVTWFSVTKFTNEVNEALNDGWKISKLSIEKKGLRIFCYAIMFKTNDSDV